MSMAATADHRVRMTSSKTASSHLFVLLVYIVGWTCAEARAQSQDWKTYTTVDGLAANSVHAVLEGSNGSMWFATEGGVSRFDENHWTTYPLANLQSLERLDYTRAILEASDGSLWVATHSGVSQFDGKNWKT